MNLEINQNNLHLLLPGKISRMAEMYMKDYRVSLIEAIRRLYSTETYKMLECEDTKLWHYGPVALYEMARDEQ